MSNVINQKDMKNINLVEVLDLIREKGSVTRKEIQNETGLSWGGASQIITQLTMKNLIVNTKNSEIGVSGRKPELLSLNTEDNFVIGIDINMSGIYAVVTNLCGDVMDYADTDMNFSNRDELIEGVVSFIGELIKNSPRKSFMAIGVSMQGRVDEKNGISRSFEGMNDWEDVPLRDILTEKFSIPVNVAHDPDCLLTSATSGGDAMLIRIDYGIGMAVMKDGNLISSVGMPEIGKTVIMDNNGQIKGRLFDFATIPGIEKSLGEKIKVSAGRENRECLEKVFEKMALYLGTATANAMMMFDVRTVYLCGKLTEYSEIFLDKYADTVKTGFGENVTIELFDVKRAAIGAAETAIKKKIFVV